LGQIEKAQLAESFKAFLQTLRLEQERKSDFTTEVSDINREPGDPWVADRVDVPVVLYSKVTIII
jgi:hypothetical protein